MKWKVIAIAAILLLTLQIILRARASGILEAQNIDPFNIEILDNHALGFQQADVYGTEYQFIIEVTDGIFNGSSANLVMDDSSGTLTFTAQDTGTLKLYSPSTEEMSISASGGVVTELGNNTKQMVIGATQVCSIGWNIPIFSYTQYTMFAIGMIGVGMLIFSPSWLAWKIKQGGDIIEIGERGMYVMLIFIVGLGLVFVWLWG